MTEPTPDAAVTGPRHGLMVAVIVASTAALLGTSNESGQLPDDDAPFTTTYTFERKGLDGGSVELTADQPRVTFYVNLRVDELGPEGVVTSNGATALLRGNLTGKDLAANLPNPAVNFKLSTPSDPSSSNVQVFTNYQQGLPLAFSGNCAAPTQGAACRTSFALELARSDDGSAGGTVHVEWSFDVSARSTVPSDVENSTIGPADVPWTIEVTR